MKQLPLIFTILVLTSCNFKSSEDYRKIANNLEKHKKYKEAILILDQAIEKDPKNIMALLDRGADKSITEDFQGAILDYSKVIEIDADNGLAYLNSGKNKMRINDNYGAIADFDKCIATKGGERVYMDKVENSLMETGFEYDVKMEEVRFERGIAYYNIESLKKAFDDFNFSIQKNYSLTDSYYCRGVIYLSFSMKEEGCADLLRAKDLGDAEAAELFEKNCNLK